MKVEFYGVYRHPIGAKSMELELPPGRTIFDALHAVAQRFPVLKDKMFNPNGDLYSYQPLYVNGRNPRLLEEGLHTLLKDEDVLSIFSPISSGRINVEAANKAQDR